MCLICVEFQKQRMTTFEARRALGEMVEGLEPDHVDEVEEMIEEAEEEQAKKEQAKKEQAAKAEQDDDQDDSDV